MKRPTEGGFLEMVSKRTTSARKTRERRTENRMLKRTQFCAMASWH
ncbi:unnamed protein product [Hymenolepis diminuta]|uniref:BZIP domain-containing protein n=1 Tax=Hymenolepis diminuta TaxID=6216 RepID=A0A0R3SJA2_HYMDI|nr:unnamed protein product [Hymenolepis diminuta]